MSSYRGWWMRKVRKARAAGKANGAKMIPSIEATEITDWEFQVQQNYEAVARERKVKFDKQDAPLKEEFQRIKGYAETAKRHYDNKAKERLLNKPVSGWAAWLGIIAIILLESPINWAIFSAFTGDSDVVAGFLAIMISLIFAVWGHLLGVHIRHGKWLGKLLVHIVSGIVVLASLVAIAYLRMYIFNDPIEGPLSDSKYLLANVDLRVLAGLFLSLNILLVVVAGWLGYESHDADEDYEVADKQYRKYSSKLNRLIRKRAKVRADCVDDLGVYCDNCHELLHIYREENLMARENRTIPAVWRNPEKLPDRLISIDKFGFDLGDNAGVN